MVVKNNVTRFLDSHKVIYTAFELPNQKLGAEETANLLGVPLDRVYKTIVLLRPKPGKPILALVPGNREVDLKLAAEAVGEKKLHVPTEREAEQITRLEAGGISPLALINKGFQILMDISTQKLNEIHISGGQRGLNIRLSVNDLIKITNAKVARLTIESSANDP
jgi:Cys-tRNA(Pro)/Cys-tRNA(Cys) deacylase